MSELIQVTAMVRVDNEEEFMKIQEAAFSGALSDIIRLVVLHGYVGLSGGNGNKQQSERKRAEASIELQRIPDQVGTLKRDLAEPAVEEKVQPRGLQGRRRIGRA